MKIRTLILILSIQFLTGLVWAHTHMLDPIARLTALGINPSNLKTGPCGNLAPSSTPTVITPGTDVTIKWEETIEHPGRYYIKLASDNTITNILQEIEILDEQSDRATIPHQYSVTISIPPDLECPDCTIQLIQSMEEDPLNPRFYYSCSDINITANPPVVTPPPDNPPPDNGGENNTSNSDNGNQANNNYAQPELGGCGSITPPTNGSGPWGIALLLFIPLMAYAHLRRRQFSFI